MYKARDTHLERRHRFIQEARAASALNHPNIVTVHVSRVASLDAASLELALNIGTEVIP